MQNQSELLFFFGSVTSLDVHAFPIPGLRRGQTLVPHTLSVRPELGQPVAPAIPRADQSAPTCHGHGRFHPLILDARRKGPTTVGVQVRRYEAA